MHSCYINWKTCFWSFFEDVPCCPEPYFLQGILMISREKLWKKGPFRRPILDPKIGIFSVLFKVIFWATFWTRPGPVLGPILGPILGPHRPKMGMRLAWESHNDLRRPKKLHFQKVDFVWDCRHFFALEGSQESLQRLKKAPKRHLICPEASIKRDPKNGPQKW